VLNLVLPHRSLADERREREEIACADAEAAGQDPDAQPLPETDSRGRDGAEGSPQACR